MAKKKIQIPKLILDHLLQYGQTSILGLGTLYFQNHSAYFSDDKSQICPPSNTLTFNDTVDDTDLFAHYVAYRLGIKPVKALRKVDDFSQELINNLLNYGEASILKIGTFTKKEGQDIEFAQEQGEVNSEFFGLVPVQLSPIQYYKNGEAIATEMAVSTMDIPSRSYNRSTTAAASQNKTTYNYDDDDDSKWIKPLLSILGTILILALLYKGCQTYKSNKAESVAANGIENSDSTQIKTDYLSDTLNFDTLNNRVEDKNHTTIDTKTNTPTECVIILGAFESARNAMKMSAKLSQLGYKSYEEYFDTMDVTRVGFKFDCSDKDLRKFILDVRKEIAKDAWYLVPRITVD